MTDRVPPHNDAVEEHAIGVALLDKTGTAARMLVDRLDPADFYKPAHQHIATAIFTLVGNGEPVEPVTVGEQLRRVGLIDDVGGQAAVNALAFTNTAAISAAGHYFDKVGHLATSRRLIEIGSAIVNLGYDEVPADRAFTEARRALDGFTNGNDEHEVSTWLAVDLADAVAGRDIDPATILRRIDGIGLLYLGRVHWFQGEAESLKSLAAQVGVAEVLGDGNNALWIDYEDDDRGIVARLLSIGVDKDVLLDRDRFRYVRPDEPLATPKGFTRHMTELQRHLTHPWHLAIVDGVTEAMTTEGLQLIDNTDIAVWLRRLPRRIALAGAAVVCIDHVAKNATAGRHAIGGQHKLAGVSGATFKFTVNKRLRRALTEPTTGRVTITVEKDRPGWVRARAEGDDDVISVFEVTAWPDGGASTRLLIPADAVNTPEWRLLVEILEYLTVYDGASKNAVETSVSGRAEVVRAAMLWLVQHGWVTVTTVGRSHRHSITDAGRDQLNTGTNP